MNTTESSKKNIRPIGPHLEVDSLLDQLETLCRTTERSDDHRLSVYRTLHSLKSWASVQRDTIGESLLHFLEADLGKSGSLTDSSARSILEVIPDLRSRLLSDPQEAKAETIRTGATEIRTVCASDPEFTDRQAAQLRELRASDHTIHQVVAWVSPEERMPLARMLLLQSILEDHILVYAEFWVWRGAESEGPFRLDDVLPNFSDQEVSGGVFRAVLGLPGAIRLDTSKLWIDQVEALYHATWSSKRTPSPSFSGFDGVLMSIPHRDRAVQNLFLQLTRFMPDLGGMSVNSYLSYESNWDRQMQYLYRSQASDASDYLNEVFRQSTILEGRSADEKTSPVAWRLYSEKVLLTEGVLQSLGQIVVQLVRNSIAHARQTSRERADQNKHPAMLIHLSLFMDGTDIVLQYSDDGRGIDPDEVMQKSGGLAGELASNAEILLAIAKPGFSTGTEIMSGSGRGMGLNLVDHQVKNILRGTWQLDNRAGKGTRFVIRFPENLFPLSIVLCTGLTGPVAIPSVCVEGLHSLRAVQIERESETRWFVRIGGRKMPLKNGEIGLHETLDGLVGLVLNEGDQQYSVLPVKAVTGSESVFVEAGSEAVYSSSLSTWIRLYGIAPTP